MILSDRIDSPILPETRNSNKNHPKSPPNLPQSAATLSHTHKELEITTKTMASLID